MPDGPPHSYVGGMSQISHPSPPFAHPLVLWAVLREHRARRVSARQEHRRARWDQAAWQRWADQPPAHPLVAGGRGDSSYALTR